MLFFESCYQVIKKREKKNNPNFQISIGNYRTDLLPSPDNSTYFILDVSIDNIGDPGIAKDWSLVIEIPDSPPQQAIFKPINKDLQSRRWPSGDNLPIALVPLEDKTENAEIIGKIRGNLLFLLQGISPDEIGNSEGTLTLSVKGKNGVAYSKKLALKERDPVDNRFNAINA